MMRVAILADTHGKLDSRIEELVCDCDLAVHGGDIGHAGILGQLQPRSGHVYAVCGNNDIPRKWPDGEQNLLDKLPEQLVVELPGGNLVVVHGHQLAAAGRHAHLRHRYPRARAIVYGHSHRLTIDQDALPWVLNPGAAGRDRTYGGPSCLILKATQGEWRLETHRFELKGKRRAKPRSRKMTSVAGAEGNARQVPVSIRTRD
ncbi:MAG: metallophosphoesterase family protein [Thiohalocapsa sp. PB-PSB1]|jgi:putative phosphoesterase|nr:MAG: hypothetical protein N838_22145 [Thiohalocapsa sp. PB-PSB1]QQO56239.1 MAG: metallophosphoesterase family protein [Thiohalocapsa sp. PB-PSB1]HCS90430.1 metallophosphoesterase [Chromatiaceae bacterium]